MHNQDAGEFAGSPQILTASGSRPVTVEAMKKLRILCLHGYHGNARILKGQMSALTGELDHLAEFIYVDAPSLSQGDFGWWHAVTEENPALNGSAAVGPGVTRYQGWTTTRERMIALLAEKKIDGILGFSQGGALAALLVGLRAPDGKTTPDKPLAFDFAMTAGAFLANDPALAKLYEAKASYDLPSLHIIGRADSIVPGEASRKAAAKFARPVVLEHGGGHIVAATPEICKQCAFFLEERIRLSPSKNAGSF
jgi:pimeloyl-ACP methyl ester carboxylesterase